MGRDTTMEEIQAYPRAHQSKAVARGATLGAPAPTSTASRAHLALAHDGVWRRFLVVSPFVGAKPSYSHYKKKA
jgi:hypothetical protein